MSHSDSYWVVVKVESGIPTVVNLCHDEATAIKQEQSLRADMNLEDDETGVFVINSSHILSADLTSASQ
jgi:hypothetical protein